MRIIILSFIFCGLLSSCNNKQETIKSNNEIQKPLSENEKSELDSYLYAFYTPNPTNQFQKDQNELIEYAVAKELKPERSPSGLYMVITQKGDGEPMKWGDSVSANYEGLFVDGQKFDSSYDRGTPIHFKIGQMNAAWNEALPKLKKGAKVTLLVPSKLAYGERGFPGFVPPNTPLIFNLEVLK